MKNLQSWFILFSIGLDSGSTKKIGTKINSGLVLEKNKRTQVLVMKIRPSFKVRKNPIT
jgi:hypothetical protein